MQQRNLLSGLTILAFLLVILSGCGKDNAVHEKNGAIEIFITTPPHAWLVKQIGGAKVNVHTLLKPGDNPHTFEATPKQMLLLKKSRIFFTSEMRLEEVLIDRFLGNEPHKSSDRPELVPLDHIHRSEHHHDASVHDCATSDPHTWLNPAMLRVQAQSITAGLKSIVPDDSAFLQNNLQVFLDSLQKCEKTIEKLLEPYAGKSFLVFHPSFGHFAEAFNLTQIAIEHEGKSPSPRQLQEIIARSRKEKIKVVFVQPQFDQKAASTVSKAIDAKLVELNPLNDDIIGNLLEIANKIAASFSD